MYVIVEHLLEKEDLMRIYPDLKLHEYAIGVPVLPVPFNVTVLPVHIVVFAPASA